MKINTSLSAKYYSSRNGNIPKIIVIHYTGGNKKGDLNTLTGKTSRQVSCHYYIDKTGEIYQLVSEFNSAYHAGISKWDGNEVFEWSCYSVNKVSLGIELENSGYEPYTEQQIKSLIDLIKDIRIRWNIVENNIVGHNDVSPGRKIDPGQHFPWLEVKKGVFGVKENYPTWSKEGVKFCKKYALITKITGEPMPDYRMATILERFYKLISEKK